MTVLFVIITVLLVLQGFDSAILGLPLEIVNKIDSYLSPKELFRLRLINREIKGQVEEYAKRNLVTKMSFGLVRDWQLLMLKTGHFSLKEQIYTPIKCKNHIKLLKFIANYPEFRGLYNELRNDVRGFLKPMIKYYENRIHGLDKFVEIFECEYLMRREESGSVYDYEYFFMIIAGLQCLQG